MTKEEIDINNSVHLLDCPFCGAKHGDTYTKSVMLRATQRKTLGWGVPCDPYTVYEVTCTKCGASIGGNRTGYNGILDRTITDEEAKQTCANRWNRRSK